MSATLTSPASPTESPCLVNCDVVTTTSTTAPAEVTTGSGNGWPDGANRLGAVTPNILYNRYTLVAFAFLFHSHSPPAAEEAMSGIPTFPSSPEGFPCLINCIVTAPTSSSTTAAAQETAGNGNDGSPSGPAAVTYYSAIALAIVLLICVAIFSRFLYTRRLRKAYAQRAAQNSVLHARELEDQRRRGEADGLPGYYEPSGPAPLPVQPTIDQLSGGRNEVSWLPAWMR
ncbi:hypothetical protein BT69DRAFT_1358317, partial [Atractiella rhizophila]